jgi:hypothetical protein
MLSDLNDFIEIDPIMRTNQIFSFENFLEMYIKSHLMYKEIELLKARIEV